MRITLIILFAAMALGTSAMLILPSSRADDAAPTDTVHPEAEASESDAPAPAEAAEPAEKPMVEKVLNGIIRANKTVRLSPITRGIVAEVNKKEGDEVKEGEVLARLRYDRAEIEYGRAGISVELSEAEEDLARLELEFYTEEYNDILALEQDNAASEKEVKEAEQNVKRAKAGYKIEQGKLKMALEILKYRKADLEDTKIISPIKGIVTQKLIEIGEMFEPDNYKPMFEVIDIDVVRVHVYLPLECIPNVNLNDTVQVKVELSNDVLYAGEGKVIYLAPTIDAGSDTMLAYIEVPNSQHKIKVGLRAEVTFRWPEDEDIRKEESPEE